jgi:colanic acid/amylovoran biosynthesis glycosyltransferase
MDMKKSMENLGLSAEKAFVNYPAIDIRMFTKKKDDVEKTSSIGFSIVSTGRLHYLKGYVYSIDAISDLIADGHDLYYHIIGDGPDLEALKFLIAERGLTDRIILHGRLNSIEVKKILLSSNIFLLPSLSEGMSNAALEAMCLELPVITTNAGGMSELVQDGINGLVVQRRSSSEIQSAILRMLLDYPKALIMGEMGRQTIIERHDIQKQIGIFESEYQKSLVIE